MGIGQLVSGLTVRQGAPWAVVGEAAINLAPPPVKNFAISAFGSNDKNVLVAGILVVLAIFAAVVGVLALRRLAYGYLGLAIFAAVGVAAAISLPKANLGWAAPTVFGALVAAFFLTKLTQRALAATAAPVAIPPPAAAEPPGEPVPDTEADPEADPGGPSASPSAGTVSPASASAWTRSGTQDPADGVDDPWTPHEPAPAGPPPETWTYRPLDRTGRRRFLVASGLAVGTTAVAAFAGRELNARQSVTQARSSVRLPKATDPAPPLPAGVDLKIPNLSPFVTSNTSFYRVDTAIVLPQVPSTSWSLRIHGMVRKEIQISFKELLRRPLIEDYITLCCVSNPVGGPYVGNARWLGASVASLLREAGIRAGADQLLCTSADGFTSGTPIQTVMDGRDAMLAVAMNGTALPVAHGFPVRLVVPGLYGYVSACKWITDIEVTTFAANHAYWTVRGWDQQAPIKTESRIDVPNGLTTLRPGRIAVAGVAWAQHKGIAAVEARVDGGPWHEARLAAVPDIDTWRQWVWEWEAAPGRHLIQARATDKTGYTQTAVLAQPAPNGASGYPAVSVIIDSA